MAEKWTYNKCYEIAKTCRSRVEFFKRPGRAYHIALANGWIDEWEWLSPKKKRNYYTYEKCYEIAKSCKCVSEMNEKSTRAYEVARKNGWLNDYTWFVRKQLPNGYWCYETCYEEAKGCLTKSQFKAKNATAYRVARENGWLKDYTWFVEIKKPSGFWTYERCYEVAKSCSCSSEMNRINGTAYGVARENGWLKDYVWFETPVFGNVDMEEKTHLIYVYEDAKNKVCYVGRTKNLHNRHLGHNRCIKGKYDGVKSYFLSVGEELPSPIVLEESLTAEESQIKEDYWKAKYNEMGWVTVNKAKTGKGTSSLGGGFVKWTHDTCLEEAKKHESIARFQEGAPSAYNVARRNGWLTEYVWFTRPENWNKKWNYETCLEEAKKYRYITEFEDAMPGCVKVARQNGWLRDYTWLTNPILKPVSQYTTDGVFVKQYKSVKEAAESIGRDSGNLSRCSTGGQKTCGGFIWKYQ